MKFSKHVNGEISGSREMKHLGEVFKQERGMQLLLHRVFPVFILDTQKMTELWEVVIYKAAIISVATN